MVLCKRVQSAEERTNRGGTRYWVHRSERTARFVVDGPASDVVEVNHAPVHVLDRAYRIVLGALSLRDEHRAKLRARGFSDEIIDRNGYRTLPLEGRKRVATRVVDHLGEQIARAVPGIFVREKNGNTWWSFAGAVGMIIPLRDLDGRIFALKTRTDDPNAKDKYLYITSNRREYRGPKAMQGVHAPIFDGDRTTLRITEGELKADAITVLSSTLTISAPGAGNWAYTLPIVEKISPKKVLIAFDTDHRTNPDVATALRDLRDALVGAQNRVTRIETWDPSLGKGLDDVLARRLARV